MRIGLLTTSYPRFPGDLAGGFVAEHAAFLSRAGHDVEVIAADGPGRAALAERSTDGPRVRWVAAPPGLFDRGGAPEALAAGGRSYLAAARFSVALAREVRRRAPGWDAVIAHWLVPGALAALAAARGLPLLAIAHSGDVHLLRRLRLTGAVGALLSRPDVRISFVTDELRRLFVAGAPGCTAPMQVCSMGVDVARLRDARRDLVRAGGGPPAVLFLGRLVPVKGVDVLIRAAALWRCPARLVVAGAGPLERELRALADAVAPGRVDFVGALHGAERDRALGAADLVALPSVRVEGGRSEGLPMVALEAIASGAELVASAVGGLTELPSDVVTLVPPGDPGALAAAVDRLHLQGSQRTPRTGVHDRIALAFDWTSVGPSLLPPPSPSRHTGVRSRKPFRTTA
jgi:glycosyltransferase involved in cell wall biosynthesis